MTGLTCPCCGYRSVASEQDICQVCGWQHDTAQEAEPYTDSAGPNPVSLKEAQANFATIGASTPRLVHRVEPDGMTHYSRDPQWLPLAPLEYCGCCGYRSVVARLGEQCDVCRWKYDPAQEERPYDTEGANSGLCLRDAKRHFLAYGACHEGARPYARTPDDGVERDPYWRGTV